MHLECASWSSGHNLAHRAAVRESFAQYYKPKALHTPSMDDVPPNSYKSILSEDEICRLR